MNYQIQLDYKPYKPQQATSLYLITGFGLVGVGAFTFLLASTDWVQTVFHTPIISYTILGIFSLVYGLFVLFLTFSRSKWLIKNAKKIRLANLIDAAILAILFLLSQWWLAGGIAAVIAAANAFAYFYEQNENQILLLQFDTQNIQMPATARTKQLEWSQIERVLLRHGNITIDCSNNVLYQWSVKSKDINSTEFESFCAAQIEENRTKRDAEDW